MPNQAPDCLFCQIINDQVPASVIFENDNVIAFLDINPVNPGHTLIVPKNHSMNMLDQDDEILKEMIVVSKKVAQAILDSFEEYEAFNLELNNGRIAGQIVPHLHWHIVPRKSDDGLRHWPGKPYAQGQAEEIADKIKIKLEI